MFGASAVDYGASNCTGATSGNEGPVKFGGFIIGNGGGVQQASDCSSSQFDNNGLTTSVGGLYVVTATLAWASNTTTGTDRRIRITVNNNEAAVAEGPPVTESGKFTQQSVSAIVGLSSGDVVQLQALQDSGATLGIQGGTLSMSYLSDQVSFEQSTMARGAPPRRGSSTYAIRRYPQGRWWASATTSPPSGAR